MIVVADASVLVGELLRRRGPELLTHPNLRVVIAEDQWDEAEHELSRRLEILAMKGILTAAQRDVLQRSVRRLIESRAAELEQRVRAERGCREADPGLAGRSGPGASAAVVLGRGGRHLSGLSEDPVCLYMA